MMDKKGLTPESLIVGIIILVIGAAVIFFFIQSFPFRETIDKEACHQSVILRSQSLIGWEPGKTIVPLNCKTQELKIKTGDEDVIKREIANQMYDCWWMLGEGKLDFFSDEQLSDVQISWQQSLYTAKSNCVICSVVQFDDNAKGKNIDVLSFMDQMKIPAKNITYLEYFTGQQGTKLPTGVEINKVDTNQDYAILYTSIKGGSYWNAVKADLASIGVGALAGVKIGKLAGPEGMLIGGAVGGSIGSFIGKLNAIKELGNARVAATRCDGEMKGCTNLVLIPLTTKDLTTACQNIESIP